MKLRDSVLLYPHLFANPILLGYSFFVIILGIKINKKSYMKVGFLFWFGKVNLNVSGKSMRDAKTATSRHRQIKTLTVQEA